MQLPSCFFDSLNNATYYEKLLKHLNVLHRNTSYVAMCVIQITQ